MALLVAIASESETCDAEIFRFLVQSILGQPVSRWVTDMRFDGCRAVLKLSGLFLTRAAEAGITHAVVAIDNDGGSKRRPEHADDHDRDVHVADEKDGCRECHLSARIPASWEDEPRRHCVAVPVQALETWILVARGDLANDAEKQYDRWGLKRRMWGRSKPPAAECRQIALDILSKPGAIDRLRTRPSFQRFERRLLAW
jgi:hypothetical protein